MENTPPPGQPQPPYGEEPTQPQPPYGHRAPQPAYDREHTRPLPPPPPGYAQHGGPFTPPPTRTARTGRGLAAGVLVGALVLGGAAGIGGAALYDSVTQDASPASTNDGFAPSTGGTAPASSVEKVAQRVLPSVVKVNVSSQQSAGSGSGIVLSKNGDILTNNHVVSGVGSDARISVTFHDGTTKVAKVTGTDPLTDVAVIKVDGASNLRPATLGKSGDLRVGQTVVAVGAPFGLESTVTSGIVSALNRPVSVATEPQQESPFGQQPFGPQSQPQDLSTTYPAIQTDAAINPGNSGGPLVDTSGRVVGMNSSIRTSSSGGLDGSQGGSIGLGFAIPMDEVLPIVNQIVDGEKPTHARLGVTVSDATSSDGLTRGAKIRSVDSQGAAADAGLKTGDVVTRVGDQVIDSSESLVATIRGHRPGDTVKVTYERGGERHTVTAKLGSDESTRSS